MNKKAIIKGGILGILLLLILIAIIAMPFSNSSTKTINEKYFLGENVKINLENYKGYKIKIIAPSTSYSFKEERESFVFKPEELGKYFLILQYENKTQTYEFEVLSNEKSALRKINILKEEKLKNGKIIRISKNSNETVLASVSISEATKDKKNIKVYWKEQNKEVEFHAIDEDNNSLIDKVEWAVDGTGNGEQTFEIIIITKAEHLDSNRTFIEDIYEIVKSKDNIWTAIPAGDYIRVVFEKNLTSNNDITIYARSRYENASIEVYEIDKTEVLATFPIISSENYYKIFLANLQNFQNAFDLKIIGAPLEIDYIIDPPEDGGVLIFNDTFTDTSGDNLFTAHTPDLGTSWTEIYSDNSNLQIGANNLDASGGNGDGSIGYADISGNWKPDQLVKATYSASASGDDLSHLIVRADSTMANAYVFTFSTTSANTALWKRVGAVNTDLNTSCGADNQFTAGDVVSLKVIGSLLQVFDSNTVVCSAIDTSIGSGRAGVGLGSSPRETTGDAQAQRLDNLLIYLFNRAPTAPTPEINSTDGTNSSFQNLNCFDILADDDNEPMNVSVRWYNNSVLHLHQDFNNSYSNGTFFETALGSGNLSVGQNWSCSLRYFDGINSTGWVNSTQLTIVADVTPSIGEPIANQTWTINTNVKYILNFTNTGTFASNYMLNFTNTSASYIYLNQSIFTNIFGSGC